MATRWITDAAIRHVLEGPPPGGFRDATEFEPHQIWISDMIANRKGAIIGAFMGAGKTASGLHGAIRCLKAGKIKRWLVIAPLHVATETWPDEMYKWDFAHEYSFSVIHGDAKARAKAVQDPAPFHFINRENLVWLWKNFRTDWPYDGLLYDEVSRLKAGRQHSALIKDEHGNTTGGGNMSEFGAIQQMVQADVFKKRFGFSGTIAPNGYYDLWGPTFLVDGGERLGRTKTAFMNRWFVEDRYSREIVARPGAPEQITDRIKDAVFTLSEDDHMLEKSRLLTQPHERWVTLPDDAMKTYKRLQRQLMLAEYDIEAVNNGVLANKLLQISSGSAYDSDGNVHFFHDRKLDELEAIYHAVGKEPMLIAYNYKFDVPRILARFPKFRVFGQSPDDISDWNNGRIPGLLLHPASGGHGINLQFGGNVMVWYGLSWSLELFQQANARLARRGQSHGVVHRYMIVAKNTYDERQLSVLLNKDSTQTKINRELALLREDVLRDNARPPEV